MIPETLRRTPLYPQHCTLGGRMVPFAGWEMPIQYGSILAEHEAVRKRAGIFDVSHMGRLELKGAGCAEALRYVSTYDVTRLAPGEGHYALICRADGGILDDIYAFRLSDDRFILVTNAANADADREWIRHHLPAFHTNLVDLHLSTGMLAIQGPLAAKCILDIAPGESLQDLKARGCKEGTVLGGRQAFVSRTGYTGEDGFEIIVSAEDVPAVWSALLKAGAAPCGLGARDTLRLEAALMLYGNDIDPSANPYEAGLGWVVSLDDNADFIGRQALQKLKEMGTNRSIVCLAAEESGIPRGGQAILHLGREVGRVASGGYSPTLRRGIALGYVPMALSRVGTDLIVDVRGKPLPVRVVQRPFYRPSAAVKT